MYLIVLIQRFSIPFPLFSDMLNDETKHLSSTFLVTVVCLAAFFAVLVSIIRVIVFAVVL